MYQVIDMTYPVSGYAGCYQRPTSPTGEGKTGHGWRWIDGTSYQNLECKKPDIACSRTVWKKRYVYNQPEVVIYSEPL